MAILARSSRRPPGQVEQRSAPAKTGLWQRLFLLIHYVYLGVIAVLMVRSTRTPLEKETEYA